LRRLVFAKRLEGVTMGATVIAYWPGMTEAQFESQPGFYNDDRA